jgi:hypothetical protein
MPLVEPAMLRAGTAVQRMDIRVDIDHDYRVQANIVCLPVLYGVVGELGLPPPALSDNNLLSTAS